MPGVSTRINCAVGVVRMPRSRFRVVCATGEVMAIFWPTIWLRSVDFPTFGRPTIATNPDLKSGGATGIVIKFSSGAVMGKQRESPFFSNVGKASDYSFLRYSGTATHDKFLGRGAMATEPLGTIETTFFRAVIIL